MGNFEEEQDLIRTNRRRRRRSLRACQSREWKCWRCSAQTNVTSHRRKQLVVVSLVCLDYFLLYVVQCLVTKTTLQNTQRQEKLYCFLSPCLAILVLQSLSCNRNTHSHLSFTSLLCSLYSSFLVTRQSLDNAKWSHVPFKDCKLHRPLRLTHRDFSSVPDTQCPQRVLFMDSYPWTEWRENQGRAWTSGLMFLAVFALLS